MKHGCKVITSLAVISLVSYPFIVTLTQWLHEESLILPDSHYPWVGPQRSVLLTTIKKVHCRRPTYLYTLWYFEHYSIGLEASQVHSNLLFLILHTWAIPWRWFLVTCVCLCSLQLLT